MPTSLIVSIVRKGWGDTVLTASKQAGAHGGTVLLGRGVGIHENQSILGIAIEPEKEIVLTLVYTEAADAILDAIVAAAKLNDPGNGLAFVVPVSRLEGVPHVRGAGGDGRA